jgi:hypothetical protein
VWACASLLHLPADALDGAVERLAISLNPDGILFMSFKRGEGTVIDEGRSTILMTDEALVALVARQKARLSVVEQWISPDAQGRPLLWTNVLARRTSSRGALRMSAELVSSFGRW